MSWTLSSQFHAAPTIGKVIISTDLGSTPSSPILTKINRKEGTHIKFEFRIEIIVWYHVHLGHQGVHVAFMGHQPDYGWFSTGFVLGLGIIFKPFTNIVNYFC